MVGSKTSVMRDVHADDNSLLISPLLVVRTPPMSQCLKKHLHLLTRWVEHEDGSQDVAEDKNTPCGTLAPAEARPSIEDCMVEISDSIVLDGSED